MNLLSSWFWVLAHQWFCGAPVVLARIPAYVVPLTDLPSTSCKKNQDKGKVKKSFKCLVTDRILLEDPESMLKKS